MNQLLDIVVWFKEYVDQKPPIENWNLTTNNNHIIDKKSWIEGTVINHDSLKGFAFLSPSNNSKNQFIPPHLVTAYNLTEGQKIKGTVEEYTDHRSGELSTRVNNIEKL